MFGATFWFFLHCFALSYVGRDLTEEESRNIEAFLILLTKLLPCPNCSDHARIYTNGKKPKFTTGQELKEYLFHFHNDVNTRLNKMTFTMQEADDALQLKLNGRNVKDVLHDDFWRVLLWTAHSFSRTPDKPTELQQLTIKQFLYTACYAMPFWAHVMSDGRTAREVMIETLNNHCDTTNIDAILYTINTMHNSVSLEFGTLYRTVEQTKKIFDVALDNKQYPQFIRANEMHMEDQKKLLALQKQLAAQPHATTSDEAYWQNVSIALAVVLGFVLLLDLIWAIRIWKHRKHHMTAYDKTPAS